MSANNIVIVRRKENGKYQVRHEFVDDLAHALAGVEPTHDDLLIEVLGDDLDDNAALALADTFCKENLVEYGMTTDAF